MGNALATPWANASNFPYFEYDETEGSKISGSALLVLRKCLRSNKINETLEQDETEGNKNRSTSGPGGQGARYK